MFSIFLDIEKYFTVMKGFFFNGGLRGGGRRERACECACREVSHALNLLWLFMHLFSWKRAFSRLSCTYEDGESVIKSRSLTTFSGLCGLTIEIGGGTNLKRCCS